MKQNKEEEKYAKTHYELNELERPRIAELDTYIQTSTEERMTKMQLKAGDCLSRLANKRIGESFSKWKRIYTDFKEAPNNKMKGRIIKAYYDKIRMTFNKWKVLLST